MDQVQEKLRLEALLALASSLNNNQPCTASPTLNGGMNIIIPIVFSDGTTWCARIPFDDACSSAEMMEMTANLLRYLEKYIPHVPAPRLKKLCTGLKEEECAAVGVPFHLLSWIEGRTIHECSLQRPLLHERRLVLDQIARLHCDLIFQSRSAMSQAEHYQLLGIFPNPISITDWYLRAIDIRIIRVLDGKSPWGSSESDVYARFLTRSKVLAGGYTVPELDPFETVLHHHDLSRLNVLVDDKWHICGVLDWDIFVGWIPIQAACRFPAMISYADVAHNLSLFSDDRSYYVKTFRRIELETTGQSTMTQVLENEELQIFQESLWNQKELHPVFVAKFCSPAASAADADMVLRTIDEFIGRKPQYATHAMLSNLRNSLQTLTSPN